MALNLTVSSIGAHHSAMKDGELTQVRFFPGNNRRESAAYFGGRVKGGGLEGGRFVGPCEVFPI